MEITSYLLGKKSGGGGSEPTGTINITQNGEHNVKAYATANVSVGGTPTTLDEVNVYVKQYFDGIDNLPNTYETLTSEATTLYCPNANESYYYIYKTTDNKYRIMWVEKMTASGGCLTASNNYVICQNLYKNFNSQNEIYLEASSPLTRKRSSTGYTSIEDCLTAIKDNTTQYAKPTTTAQISVADTNAIILTNATIYDLINEEYKTPKRISSNETIQTI